MSKQNRSNTVQESNIETKMTEMMTVMKSFIKSSDDRAKIQDTQYTDQQLFNKNTEKKIDDITLAFQNYISSKEKNIKDYLPVETGHLFLYIYII